MSLFKTSKFVMTIIILLLVISFSLPALADENVPAKMGKKLGRGVINIATGWLELPKNIYNTTTETNPGMGITYGTLKGLGMTVVRTAAGIFDAATFLFPVPKDYDPLMKPEFVFSEEQAETSK